MAELTSRVEDTPSSYLVPNADKMIPLAAQPRRQAKGCGDLRSRVDDVSQPRTVAALSEQAAESYLLPARYAVRRDLHSCWTRRHSRGVTPTSRRKVRVKWL